jgi:hypothetical protein
MVVNNEFLKNITTEMQAAYIQLCEADKKIDFYDEFLEVGDTVITKAPEFISDLVEVRGSVIATDDEVVAMVIGILKTAGFKEIIKY